MVIDEYVAGGFTVNVCALDLSKAFDRMNHFALFIKLLNRDTPVKLLTVTCVKRGDRMSIFLSDVRSSTRWCI